MGKPRRIQVEIDSLVVDRPALAQPGEIAAAVERELTRLAVDLGIEAKTSGEVSELSVPLGQHSTTHAVGAAIARAVGGELAQ
jgi:hypothetical protein